MKHLTPQQLLEWAETGFAGEQSREHVKACTGCAEELASLRDVYRAVEKADGTPDLNDAQALQFRQDLQRKIQLLPSPPLIRVFWNSLQRLLFTSPAAIGVVATAVLVFSLVAVYRYDKIFLPKTPEGMNDVSENIPVPPPDYASSLAAADALAATQNVDESDFIQAFLNLDSTNKPEVTAETEFSGDPFHDIAGLKPEEEAQLKALLKESLKG